MQAVQDPTRTRGLEGFREFALATMKEWNVQGIGIAVAKDGQVILCEGLGLKDTANNQAVTPHTLFPIGSSSKAFTTMALGMLADEGKLAWDTPVKAYLPSFKLWDQFATERMTPRDLTTHRSGLPRHDLAWYNSSRTRQQLFESLPYFEPNQDFRAIWQYQNLMYMLAGYLVEVISGMSWDDFIRERIFKPLGMNRSATSSLAAQQSDDFSKPYTEEEDAAKEIPFYTEDGAVAPAGAINSSAADMSQWLLLHLNGGKHGDTQLISEAQLRDMHAPHMVMKDPGKYAEMPHSSYGLGWFVQPYRGHNHIHHGGNINGFSALVSFLPQDGIGAVILSNMNGSPVPTILSLNVFDRLLGLADAPWNERFHQDYNEFKEAEKRGKETSETVRVSGTQPSHPLEAYTGEFSHPGYGVLSVALKDGRLTATFNNTDFPLEHYHYDTFELEFQLFHIKLKATFGTNARGDIDNLTVPFESQASDIVFKRIPSKAMTERSFLEKFAGEYELMGMPLTVSLSGEDTLLVSLPGQPDHELEPYKGTEFTLKGLSGFSVLFNEDESGTITEALLTQPGGTFTAKRK